MTTVRELISQLQRAPQDAMCYIPTPVPTEMEDCRVTGISVDEDWCVWIQWATENAGSGMSREDKRIMEGLA